jgi:uncharacterized integral membrane protein (TIGR00698 family)
MKTPAWLPRRPDLPGLVLAAGLGAVALGISRALPPSPWVSDFLIALLLGALVLNTPLRKPLGLRLPGADRDPDRYASGLRFVGKWVLRLGIILMGMKVQTSFFGRTELLLIVGVATVALPSAFMIAHAAGAAAKMRRPMVDLLACGTMICGASAVNAAAPVAKAHREEQGVAIAIIFLFSVFAMLAFHPIANVVGLDSSFAGLWSGLAVNDLSSAIAVGAQMGGTGAMMATAAKSARILYLAPTLVGLSLMRREGAPVSIGKSLVESLPRFLIGYVGLAVARAVGDRMLGTSPAWAEVLAADKLLVDFAMLTVSAGIGLHLGLRSLLSSSVRAMVVGGAASLWMAALTLAMIVAVARNAPTTAALIAGVALVVSLIAYRMSTRDAVRAKQLQERFDTGAPLSMAEATSLLNLAEAAKTFDEAFLRRLLVQLHPSIGELMPIRTSPLPHGEGCRWVTYWEGKNGWALVALCRDPGSATPIHAHPHRLLGKAIEGMLEELRFREAGDGALELVSRAVLGHEQLVETEALSTLHIVHAIGQSPTVDLQFRGPEIGKPGRRFTVENALDPLSIEVGARLAVTEQVDDRPGHGGEGASAGRLAVGD